MDTLFLCEKYYTEFEHLSDEAPARLPDLGENVIPNYLKKSLKYSGCSVSLGIIEVSVQPFLYRIRYNNGKQGKCITLAIFASQKCLLGCPQTRRKPLDTVYIIIGFIIFCLYPWLSFSSADSTGIVQYHSC